MTNSLQLIPGQQYKVIKAFIDYDQINHPLGETWIFTDTNFLPYEDGLTLHVSQDNIPIVYRLQLREEEQAGIIRNFHDHVEPC